MVDFIAEVSSNHNRDLSRMKKLIYTSKKSGCSGIKFQLFKIDKLFATEILEKSEKHRIPSEDYEELILLEFRGIEKIKEILEK